MQNRLINSATKGFRAGLRTWWWISKITVAVTFIVVLLQWSGFIGVLSEALSPLFASFGLSAEGVIIFFTTALANIYAGIGAMATLTVDFREATLLAVMGLICHNLIVETIIQKRSGASALAMVLLRIFGALFAAAVINLILPKDFTGTLILESAANTSEMTLWELIKEWGMKMAHLIPVMFLVICGLNTVQQILREFKIINLISKPFIPIMSLCGLRRDSALMWLILNTLGLAYGGSIMIASKEEGELSLQESKLLNTHIALSHSLLEDTLLYFALGVSLFWLIVPRFILAVVCVWVQKLMRRSSKN